MGQIFLFLSDLPELTDKNLPIRERALFVNKKKPCDRWLCDLTDKKR